MCGITGIVARSGGPPPTQDVLHRMCETIVHRGPNEEGTGIEANVALGMRRLSIIDVSGGHQPILNEDASVRVVFNGEIYNYRELQRQLEDKGHRFRSRSDGEVIPHLWESTRQTLPLT